MFPSESPPSGIYARNGIDHFGTITCDPSILVGLRLENTAVLPQFRWTHGVRNVTQKQIFPRSILNKNDMDGMEENFSLAIGHGTIQITKSLCGMLPLLLLPRSLADHETGDVLQKEQRNFALPAELHKVCPLLCLATHTTLSTLSTLSRRVKDDSFCDYSGVLKDVGKRARAKCANIQKRKKKRERERERDTESKLFSLSNFRFISKEPLCCNQHHVNSNAFFLQCMRKCE